MMFFINVTLRRPEAEATAFVEAVKSLGNWSDRLSGTWLVECRMRATDIRERLRPHLLPGERLFVAELQQHWAGLNMGEGFPEWMGRRTFRTNTPAQGS